MRPGILISTFLLILSSTGCTRSSGTHTFPTPFLPTIQPTPILFTIVPPTSIPEPTESWTSTPLVQIASGDQAFFNGDWETAIQEYQLVYENSKDPHLEAAALLGLGRTYISMNNQYEAILALEELIRTYPEFPELADAYYFLGEAYRSQEQHEKAAQAFLDYLRFRTGLIDAYILDIRGDEQLAAGDYSGAVESFKTALENPSSLDQIYLKMKIAQAYLLSGDPQNAIATYDDIFSQTSNDETKALIDFRKGQIYTQLGQDDLAISSYKDAVDNYPTTSSSHNSLVALIDAGVSVNELQRGIIDYFAVQYGVAITAFNRYLEDNPPDPATAYYYLAQALRTQGEFAQAIEYWEIVKNDYSGHGFWDDAWEEIAFTQWYHLDQYREAVQTLLSFVNLAPGNDRAAEFLFDAALIAERNGELAQAIEIWERLVNNYPEYEKNPRAIFLLGISQFRLGNFTIARNSFQRYLDITNSIEEKAAAYFWIGKSQYASGENEFAQASYETAASLDPTGYYSERAADILRDRQPFTPPQAYDISIDSQSEQSRAEGWMINTFDLPKETTLSILDLYVNEPGLQRGTELWKLGLYDDARREFEILRQSYQSDPVRSYLLGSLLIEMKAYRSAIMASRQVLNLASMDDASSLSAPSYFNHLRFGTYYSDLIIPLSKEYSFHPLFILSLIRQESLFESFVNSSAGARGLMQIIPSTGEDIALNLGWPEDYSPDDLYRPIVNLKLGIEYLNNQINYFDGNIYAALAAYNSGPGNAEEWYQLSQGDPDLLLEIIRFPETREYIKNIYEIFSIYRMIYDRTP